MARTAKTFEEKLALQRANRIREQVAAAMAVRLATTGSGSRLPPRRNHASNDEMDAMTGMLMLPVSLPPLPAHYRVMDLTIPQRQARCASMNKVYNPATKRCYTPRK